LFNKEARKRSVGLATQTISRRQRTNRNKEERRRKLERVD
jgi:hypothetical protein